MQKKLKAHDNTTLLVIIGIITSMMLTLICTAVISVMINQGILKNELVPFLTFCIWTISSAAGSLISAKQKQHNTLIHSMIVAGTYLLLLFGIKIILFDDPIQGVWKGIIAVILGMLPSFVFSFGITKPKKHKFKYIPK